MQDTNRTTKKGTPMGQQQYDRIKELLKTRSPMELSQAGVCGYSTAYKVMNSTGYGDYRNKLREERERAYAKRKNAPTPIKKNVPPIGNGSLRFNPPTKPLDGTGKTETIFSSPFRDNVQHVKKEEPKNGPVVIVKAGSDQPSAVINTNSGASPEYTKPVKEPIVLPYKQATYNAVDARARNSKTSLAKHGVDAFQYVDLNAIEPGTGRKPTVFGSPTIRNICALARNGATNSEIIRYVMDNGLGNKTIDQIVRTIAYNEEGLAEFKKAWNDGKEARANNLRQARLKGAKRGGQTNKERAIARERERVKAEMEAMPKPKPVLTPQVTQQLEDFLNDDTAEKAYLSVTTETTTKPAPEPQPEPVKKKVVEVKASEVGDKLGDFVVESDSKRLKKRVKIVKDKIGFTTPFFLGVQLIMLVTKLFGVLNLDWWVVALPAIIYLGLMMLTLVMIGVLTMVVFIDKLKEEDE